MGYLLKQKTIIDVSNQLREQNKKVVFTHGSFDIFHAGHSYLLNMSKKKGEVLIVGIESAARIRKYKNPERPIIGDKERIYMLQSHKDVDFILFIDQGEWANNFYLGLYDKLSPSIVTYGKTFGHVDRFKSKSKLPKGIEYKQIRELVFETGSTTKLINKIKNSS